MIRCLLFICLAVLLFSCGSIRHIEREERNFQSTFDSTLVALLSTDKLSRSPHGNWQLRLSGQDFALGYKRGKLYGPLQQYQEAAFFHKVDAMVPNPRKQRFLIKFLKWYHRTILKDIPLAYRQEIYGLSRSASDQYDFLGTKYERSLLLHGAHDIGHAMQDLMLVGCSSVALWNENSADGKLLIGRNFDFYVSEEFAKHKIVEFIEPQDGYKYAAVSWPGMIGVVSGMNEKGLTITLNAGKSSIPLQGKTPISIVARDILQHARNIEEAVARAQKFQVFISESLLIGSAEDNSAVNIEISPKKFDVFEVENGKLLCTNHFQSDTYSKDKRNEKQIATSHSQYRLEKLRESFHGQRQFSPTQVAQVLRDVNGLDDTDIGLGNEKSLNQLLAHHAVIFQPHDLKMWVSNSPYQLGAFEAYDLREIFQNGKEVTPVRGLEIPTDSLLYESRFADYQAYRRYLPVIQQATEKKTELPDEELKAFEKRNPNLWLTPKTLGDYHYALANYKKAEYYYVIALEKEISAEKARKQIEKKLRKTRKK